MFITNLLSKILPIILNKRAIFYFIIPVFFIPGVINAQHEDDSEKGNSEKTKKPKTGISIGVLGGLNTPLTKFNYEYDEYTYGFNRIVYEASPAIGSNFGVSFILPLFKPVSWQSNFIFSNERCKIDMISEQVTVRNNTFEINNLVLIELTDNIGISGGQMIEFSPYYRTYNTRINMGFIIGGFYKFANGFYAGIRYKINYNLKENEDFGYSKGGQHYQIYKREDINSGKDGYTKYYEVNSFQFMVGYNYTFKTKQKKKGKKGKYEELDKPLAAKEIGSYIEGYIKKKLELWEQKSEFEKTADHQARITEGNRQKATEKYRREAITYYGAKTVKLEGATPMLSPGLQMGAYDADKELFKITIPNAQSILLTVPIREAQTFKESWPDAKFTSPEYVYENEQFIITQLNILLNGKTYHYGEVKVSDVTSEIVITYPIVRAKKSYTYKEEVPLTGKVTGENKIMLIQVNGEEVELISNKYFETSLKLDMGENPVVVKATDMDGRVTKEVFSIVRVEEGSVNIPTKSAFDVTGLHHALIFAINHYDSWSDLTNPVFDGKAIAEELERNYGFQTEFIEDPTLEQILTKLRSYAEKDYEKYDELFIFFAGHGQFDDVFKEGYIVAKDSKEDDLTRNSYIAYSNLRTIINNIPCDHTFLVMDVCFGGTFDPLIAASARGKDQYREVTKTEYIQRKLKFVTRRYLTSGGKEYVPDGRPGHHSPFARKLLEALRSYGGEDGILTINEILSYVEKVEPQPRTGEFGNNEPGSDFIFIAK